MKKHHRTVNIEESETLLSNPAVTEPIFARGGSGGFFSRRKKFLISFIIVILVLAILIPLLVVITKALSQDHEDTNTVTCAGSGSGGPTSNPFVDAYGPDHEIPAWIADFPWSCVFNIIDYKGATDDDRYASALKDAAAHGGVIFFPAGTYSFVHNLNITSNVILRGEVTSSIRARRLNDASVLQAKFVFPDRKHLGFFNNDNSSNFGIVNIFSQGGAVMFWPNLNTASPYNLKSYWYEATDVNVMGENKTVFGCTIQQVSYSWPDPDHPLQGNVWPWRYSTAIAVYGMSNLYVAMNYIPFTQAVFNVTVSFKGYDGDYFLGTIPYPYDDRYGIDVNKIFYGIVSALYCRGTITTSCFPYYFSPNVVIRDNVIETTGKTAIIWSGSGDAVGEGPYIFNNVVHFQPNITCYSLDGIYKCVGNSSNNNRAFDQSGYAHNVVYNEAVVYKQTQLDGSLTEDGEAIWQTFGTSARLTIWENNKFVGGDDGSMLFHNLDSVSNCTVVDNSANPQARIGAVWDGQKIVEGNVCEYNSVQCTGMT